MTLSEQREKDVAPAEQARTHSPKVAVAFATYRRPEILYTTVKYILEQQTHQPAVIIVSCVDQKDAGQVAELPNVKILTGTAGLTKQRNAVFEHIPHDIDIIVFFDDDFIPHPTWLSVVSKVFQARPEIAAITGKVVVDGIKGPGLTPGEAVDIIARTSIECGEDFIHSYSPYGCNMAFRISKIGGTRFDERLPMYGWLEDRDFGARVAKLGGLLVKYNAALGVHLGVKIGRVSGLRFGFSQIVNPVYLYRKQSMTLSQMMGQIYRNVASNIIFSFRPEPYIDRRGRLFGNILGILELCRGRIEPERAATLVDKRS